MTTERDVRQTASAEVAASIPASRVHEETAARAEQPGTSGLLVGILYVIILFCNMFLLYPVFL